MKDMARPLACAQIQYLWIKIVVDNLGPTNFYPARIAPGSVSSVHV